MPLPHVGRIDRFQFRVTIMLGMIFCIPFTLLLNQQWHFDQPPILGSLYLGIVSGLEQLNLVLFLFFFVSFSVIEPIFGILFAILFLQKN
ncbi:hypothetical protein INT80_01115 [Gallibacterium anatis]|uniref:Uncharacterized protein n=1 Tax=Gallibacterium anatis TaxID=750 RepID=A0A930Y3F7_9PAST|nr:hypothetical protein [Gallibacterium anatis]